MTRLSSDDPAILDQGIWGVLLAGGAGSRFGAAVEKQYLTLADGRRMVDAAASCLSEVCDKIVLVVPEARIGDHEPGFEKVVVGGQTRSASVRAGLAAIDPRAKAVLIHDAARPFASKVLARRVLEPVLSGEQACVPVIAVVDTIKMVTSAKGREIVVQTPDRSSLRAVQTPQAFAYPTIVAAHDSGEEAFDDATLVEQRGVRVTCVEGEATNLKVTYMADMDQRSSGLPSIRVGFGQDSHRFSDDPNTALVIGGVIFEGRGLVGHSDADVLAHAITDAILGAAGLSDIGTMFPDSDANTAGADSIEMLEAVCTRVAAAGFEILHVDCNVISQDVRISPRRDEIRAVLSRAIGVEVNVKAKTAEHMGALGRGEGIAANAVVTVSTAPRRTHVGDSKRGQN